VYGVKKILNVGNGDSGVKKPTSTSTIIGMIEKRLIIFFFSVAGATQGCRSIVGLVMR
jgi:hypothetical protein